MIANSTARQKPRFKITYSTPEGTETDVIEADSFLDADDEAHDRMMKAWADKAWAVVEACSDDEAGASDFDALPNSLKLQTALHQSQLDALKLFTAPKAKRPTAEAARVGCEVDHEEILSLFRPTKSIGRGS